MGNENKMMDGMLERLLNSLHPGVLNLVIKLRILVIGSNPGLVERVYPSWKTIGYGSSVKMSAQVCYIEAMEKSVRLGFNRGAFLPDPKHLLEGTGDLLRFIQFNQEKEINSNAILDLLRAAWKEAARL